MGKKGFIMSCQLALCLCNVRPTPSHDSVYCRSNHLNGPDFDAFETASVASCSSAYSSKSESSIMSPPCGSVTELSDAGSCDTFQEYEISNQRKQKVSSYTRAEFVLEKHIITINVHA